MASASFVDIMDALRQAVVKNSVRDCTKLLQSGIDWKENGICLLIEAIINGNSKILELILSNGAWSVINDICFAQKSGTEGSLMVFKENGTFPFRFFLTVKTEHCPEFQFFKAVLNRLGYDECSTVYGIFTPLLLAVKCANIAIIEMMLKFGAAPLTECILHNKDVVTELKCSSSLPNHCFENVIKYAALHFFSVDCVDLRLLYNSFYGNRAYMNFFQQCLKETKTLKSLVFDGNKSNLFDFILSQGDKLKSHVDDSAIMNNVLNILRSTALPIYKVPIFRNMKRSYLLDSLLEVSFKRFYSFQIKEICLTSECIENICNFLSNEDLGSLLIAFKFD